MADPLTPDDVEHEDDRDRYEWRLERRLERERYAPNLPTGSPDASVQPDAASAHGPRRHPEQDYGVPPLVAAARRDQALIDATLCDNECSKHERLPGEGPPCGCFSEEQAA